MSNLDNYDIVIVGGGIHGAGCAQAAAARGYSCLLLEQYSSPAQGTSSRSSKLIHGGLRYLESAQFSLVKECLTERKYLLANAPELVKLVPFHIPVYKHSKRRPWKICLGLMLYFLLGGGRFKKVQKKRWSELDSINTKDLLVVYQYRDAQTNDAELTKAVINSAQSLGAEVLMNANVTNAERVNDIYNIKYTCNNEILECRAQCVINASGPWVNSLLNRVKPAPSTMDVDLVAGTHLVLPGHLDKGIYYLESPSDGRAIFVAPWEGNILIGTTETIYTGDPGAVTPTKEEVDYLLAIYNDYFSKQLTVADILQSFAGLRVLPVSDNSAFHRPRETVIQPDNPDDPRLFSIYGGKLTAYRATAELVIDKIESALGSRQIKVKTKNLKL